MLAIDAQSIGNRDEEVVSTLERRVPMLSLDQIAVAWWDDADEPEHAAEERLQALERRGLVRCFAAEVPNETFSEGPLVRWEPGDEEPDFDYVAGELKRRLAEPTAEMLCVVAADTAAEAFGRAGESAPAKAELAHAVRLAAAYLRIRLEHPLQAYTWKPSADPRIDAMMEDRFFTRPREVAVLCAREQDAEELREAHRVWSERGTPYRFGDRDAGLSNG